MEMIEEKGVGKEQRNDGQMKKDQEKIGEWIEGKETTDRRK